MCVLILHGYYSNTGYELQALVHGLNPSSCIWDNGSGSSLSGILYPIIMSRLVPRIGFGWCWYHRGAHTFVSKVVVLIDDVEGRRD
jgi:hypothetical protein